MGCQEPKPIYVPHSKQGINGAVPAGDGYIIAIDWTQAYPDVSPYRVIYNIYYSTIIADVFKEGVKAVSVQDNTLAVDLLEFTPGDTYYFAVRATEYDPGWYDPSLLPTGFPGLKVYPEAVLLQDITDVSTSIPISDIDQFPNKGIVQIGHELIRYIGRDVPSNSLLVSSVDRGFLNTEARIHETDGYDGFEVQDPFVRFWKGHEDDNVVIHQATSKFIFPNHARTNADGYREKTKDDLNTDLSASDASQVGFQVYDFSGYHRTDPASLLAGDCLGSYYGGEQFCADGYGVGFQLRGLPLNEANNQRQEILLEVEGEPCVLARRLYTGITCSCVEPASENPNLRCGVCLGTSFITGYDQYFNPRRSDGRILVRFDPTDDDVKIEDDGFESVLLPSCWTLVVPALKSRDFLIRFNEDGTEEFRYEILSVTRSRLINTLSGAQKFKAQRVRRTDPIYQFRAIRDTSTIPQTITTGIGMVAGPGGILPHTHTITIHEGIVSLTQINETTSVSMGHNHPIQNGVVQEVLSHSHTIILP